ncbi:hypothetical protein [Cupriavidus necator]
MRKKYFARIGERNWVFGTTAVDKKGKPFWVELYSLAGTPIRRHKKVRGDYHPFDPAQELYGERLRQERMSEDMSHRKQWHSCGFPGDARLKLQSNQSLADWSFSPGFGTARGGYPVNCSEIKGTPVEVDIG